MFGWALAALSVLVLCRWALRKLTSRAYDIQHLPFPRERPSWIFGHEFMVWKHPASELYFRWSTQLGSIYRIAGAFFHPDIIVTTDHAAVHHVLQYPDIYSKSAFFRPFIAHLLGKGVIWAEGELHKKQRRLIAPAFSTEAVKGMADMIIDCAEKWANTLHADVLKQSEGLTVNIMDYTSDCTLDIIGLVAFGHDFDVGQREDAKAINKSLHDNIQSALQFRGFIAPIIIRTFPFLSPLALLTEGKVREIVTKLSSRLIERGENFDRPDMLSILLKANKMTFGERLTTEQLLGNIVNFTLAGHDTSSVVLTYTLLDLARCRDKQEILRKEIQESDGDFSYDNIHKFVYLDAVVKEGLRRHPAAPRTERVALKDDVIPLKKTFTNDKGKSMNSMRVKAGQVIYIPFTAMNVDEETWGPTASEFVPERWLIPGGIPSKEELPQGWSGLMTFADGPRNCIGYRMALFELKVIIASLVRSLEFHDTGAEIVNHIPATLQPVVDGRGGYMPLRVVLASNA